MESSDKYVEAIAHPTIGIVLLGGLSDPINRIPLHGSAGIAYTIKNKESVARTRISLSDKKNDYLFNGKTIDESSRSPISFIQKYEEKLKKKYKVDYVNFESENQNILSGSSDAGAAALGKCIQYLLPDEDPVSLENYLRIISESVGRSLYGGLTVTEVRNDATYTRQVLTAEEFGDFEIIAFTFPHERKPSDDIHFNVKKLQEYSDRVKSANSKLIELQKLAENKDIKGIFELAHKDTDEYHSIVERAGVKIITPEMRSLMVDVNNIRKNTWCSYIVTGGNNVFVVTRIEDSKSISDKLQRKDVRITKLNVADSPRVTSSRV